MANFTAGTSFSDGVTNDVTAAKLNALVADAVPTSNLSLNSTIGTIANFTASTANITLGTIPTLTAGTTTGTAGVFTSGTITTGLIPTLTAGTTTGTAGIFTSGTIATLNSTTGTISGLNTTTGTIATLNSTTGTIVTLNSTTGTIAGLSSTNGTVATLNSTTGTIAGLRSTTGTVVTLNSTTGTITNLSTTLAGDFTISQGTGTLGTTAVTAGSYGSVSAIPFITVDAKGRVTNATTGTFSSTPADGSITFAKLSTSATEADNVASRTAKAWVNFDGTTNVSGNCTIRADFNVSTVADNGTGDYTINFSTSLADANYSCVGAASTQGVNGGVSWLPQTNVATTIGTPAVGSLRGCVQAAGVGNIDSPYVNVAFFG